MAADAPADRGRRVKQDVEVLAFELVDGDDMFADEVAIDGGRAIA